jgi:peroxiredoxin
MKLRYLLPVIGLLVMLLACKQQGPESRGGYSPSIGSTTQMVHFKLPSVNEKAVVDSDEYKGQVLLATFFATWCPSCIQEIPSLIALQNDYKKKGFSVLAFSVDQGSSESLNKFIEKYSINYPVFFADEDLVKGFGGVTGIPVSFLVNRKGEIVKKFLGNIEHDVLEQQIKKLLAEG